MKPKPAPTLLCAIAIFLATGPLPSTPDPVGGPLEPDGPPAPTMASLAEISEQVAALQATVDARLPGGKNLAVAASDGTVAAWNHRTKEWSRTSLGGTIGPITESNGNFLMISSNGDAAAWSAETSEWHTTGEPNSVILLSGGSDGNFYVGTNTATIFAWSSRTSKWTSVSLGGVLGSATTSEGNILITSSNGNAAVWCPETGRWDLEQFNGFLIPVGSDPPPLPAAQP